MYKYQNNHKPGVSKMNVNQFIKNHNLSEQLVKHCLSVGLQTINVEDETEYRAELMKKFHLSDEAIEQIILELNHDISQNNDKQEHDRLLDELKKKIIQVLDSEERGFFMSEIVTEVDEEYKQYTPQLFDISMADLNKEKIITTDEETELTVLNYDRIAENVGCSVEEVKKGYFYGSGDDGILVIQIIDDLGFYGLEKFDGDTTAGLHALENGEKLFTLDNSDLSGWYIKDDEENRKRVKKAGYSIPPVVDTLHVEMKKDTNVNTQKVETSEVAVNVNEQTTLVNYRATISVKYVPPGKVAKHFNLVRDEVTEQITFTKERGTTFTNKQDIKRLLVDMIMNRDKYKGLVESSSYLEVSVERYEGKKMYFDDQLTINFD